MKKADIQTFKKYCDRPMRIVWAVAEYGGKRSICPLGWKMNTSFSPFMMAISVAPTRFTHELIVKSGEFVLAWPGEDLAETTLFCGTCSGRNVDKFKETGLTPVKGEYVKAPLVKECIANLECKVAGQLTTGDHTIFAGEVVAVWVNENPSRLLCSIDNSGGYDFLLEKKGYRFGVVKK
ncbi:MAG TPA: flavin reductase family protein [bacterium]|nr:flavin reductase family protein [bacterium]HPP30547.1 flavin reductase family protein [bacterium]